MPLLHHVPSFRPDKVADERVAASPAYAGPRVIPPREPTKRKMTTPVPKQWSQRKIKSVDHCHAEEEADPPVSMVQAASEISDLVKKNFPPGHSHWVDAKDEQAFHVIKRGRIIFMKCVEGDDTSPVDANTSSSSHDVSTQAPATPPPWRSKCHTGR